MSTGLVAILAPHNYKLAALVAGAINRNNADFQRLLLAHPIELSLSAPTVAGAEKAKKIRILLGSNRPPQSI